MRQGNQIRSGGAGPAPLGQSSIFSELVGWESDGLRFLGSGQLGVLLGTAQFGIVRIKNLKNETMDASAGKEKSK